jgi:CBS-domain-containing membrane protein
MSAHLRGAPLWALTVADAMAKVVYGCKPGDKPAVVADLMAEHQLRRLPVVDDAGKLVGLLTLGALAQAVCGKRKKKAPLAPKDVVELVAAVTAARVHEVPTRSVIEVFREPAAAPAAPAAPADKSTLKPKPRVAKKSESTPAGAKDKKARAAR